MAQHDNGRRPTGTPTGAWQQGQREHQDYSNAQQDQSSTGRYGSQYGQQGGQQGSHHEQQGSGGQHSQYGDNRAQQGDNWRERQGPSAGGWRPAMEERDRNWNDRGGQGSFGGQASDNDYGNRGITESGNFGNDGRGRDDSYSTMSGRPRYGQGGDYDQGGQSGQRFGSYRHGYDARSDSTGGYGSGNFGPDHDIGGNWNAQRAWRDEQRYRGGQGDGRQGYGQGQQGYGSSYGQSSDDNYQGSRAWQGSPNNQDRYGDNGYQGNFQQGQRGQAYHDPDYHQWRSEQLSRLDRDYDDWRQHRYQRFADEFDAWRNNRSGQQPGTGTGLDGQSTAGSAGTQAHAGQGSQRQYGQNESTPAQADASKGHDTAHASDKTKSSDISSTSHAKR